MPGQQLGAHQQAIAEHNVDEPRVQRTNVSPTTRA
jgi:hypothetical protein